MRKESEFKWDVFLSHSAQNKDLVWDIANRLKLAGVHVWFDEWEIRPGDSIPVKIEEGLENSRVLLLFMSRAAFGSDWTQLESHTFRFKDPLNQSRRFIPLRIDDTPIKGSIAQFSYIDWRLENRTDETHSILLQALAINEKTIGVKENKFTTRQVTLSSQSDFKALGFSAAARLCVANVGRNSLGIWDLNTGELTRKLKCCRSTIESIRVSDNGNRVLVRTNDSMIRMLDIETDRDLTSVRGAGLSLRQMDCLRLLACGIHPSDMRLHLNLNDATVREHLQKLRKKLQFKKRDELRRYATRFYGRGSEKFPPLERFGQSGLLVAYAIELENSLSENSYETESLLPCVDSGADWILKRGEQPNPWRMSWTQDYSLFVFANSSNAVVLWDTERNIERAVLEGHTSYITSIALHPMKPLILSSSNDGQVMLWDIVTGRLMASWSHGTSVINVSWSPNDATALSFDSVGEVKIVDIDELTNTKSQFSPTSTEDRVSEVYTNAKVLLVGNSAAGKTGLSNRLALDTYKETDSTVGAWATQWKIPLQDFEDIGSIPAAQDNETKEHQFNNRPERSVYREVWMWDFGGQADQRMIHQLYMDQTQVAALVFDPQKDDLLETLGQWDRELRRADKDSAISPMTKLLVAGRCDAGGLRVARSKIDTFVKERGYAGYFPTSAKNGEGCQELRQAIINGIKWENIPWRSSPVLFKRLKEEILKLKDEGRVLLRLNELREVLSLRMKGENATFTNAELKAVIVLLSGPGVVWELEFGSWVLLQPERVNFYAQAVIQTVREDKFDRGCISERRVLEGDLKYHSQALRLPKDEEQFVLLAMHQILVSRGLCIRHQAESGEMLLMFPSYYRLDRQEPNRIPAVQVSYTFNGFIDEIYATLIVKLHHTREFNHDKLWRNAADFKTRSGGKSLGLRLIRKPEGEGELQAFFAQDMMISDKIIFSKYIHEHLLHSANDVRRFRHYVCPNEYRGSTCGTTANRDVVMERLDEHGREASVRCQRCDEKLKLWDDLEENFADDDIRQRVQDLDDAVRIKLDSESKERVLVGEVISTVALAGQICREIQVSDWGLDAEVEFKNDAGEASAKRVWLQLKSGDSFLKVRKNDGATIFRDFTPRHANYWMKQAEPVLLLIRKSSGEIRWMDIREELRRVTNNGQKQVHQLVFVGKRFDVMSVRGWRDVALR